MEQQLAQMPAWFWTMTALSFGAVWGSFLNVVIYRVPRGKSLVHPGSACPHCQAPIRWYDNVPVLAWVWLAAKCRDCKAGISARYPLIELLTALLSWALIVRFGPTGSYVTYFVFMLLLLSLSFIDLDLWLIPDVISIPGIVVGLALTFILPDKPFLNHLLAAGVGGGLLWGISVLAKFLMKKDAMGLGDVKLLAMIGAFCGVPSLWPVVMLSAVQGSVIGAVWLLVTRHRPPPPPQEDGFVPPKGAIPFGPFLSLAAIEYVFFSAQLQQVYRWFQL